MKQLKNRSVENRPSILFGVTRALTAAALVAGLFAASAHDAAGQALVTVVGDVGPADSPFIPGNEGIPVGGNDVITTGINIDPNNPNGAGVGDPVDIFNAPLFDEDGNQVGQFDYERNLNVIVGLGASGQVTINGGADLRFGDLVIGGVVPGGSPTGTANNLDIDAGDFGANGAIGGTGLVEIVGVGSTYNNHPFIVPVEFQRTDLTNPGDADSEETAFVVPFTYNPGPDLGGVVGDRDRLTNIRRDRLDGADGFDLYVGLTGSGVLNLTDGGVAEIQDGAFIGVAPGATGRVVVDGVGSYLGVFGGFRPNNLQSVNLGANSGEETVIGPYGEGRLEITNGGRVDSFNRAALGAIDASGDDGQGADRGGHGVVVVDGPGSVWRVFTGENAATDNEVGLSIGEFFNMGDSQTGTRVGMLFTATVEQTYNASSGSGVLTIANGGLVDVQENQGGNDNNENEAGVRIGRFGELRLAGGRLALGDFLENDGLIRTGDSSAGTDRFGDGVIDAGSFLNSPLGVIRVRGGESLSIRSQNEMNAGSVPEILPFGPVGGAVATTNYYYANAGSIEVFGDPARGRAEIEFNRERDPGDDTLPGNPPNPEDDRFQNLELAGVPSATGVFTVRGQILARDANLHFRSGFLNNGDLIFTGGGNEVTGFVDNAPRGNVIINSGAEVTFAGPLLNQGTIQLSNSTITAEPVVLTTTNGFAGAGGVINLSPFNVINAFGTFPIPLPVPVSPIVAAITEGEEDEIQIAASTFPTMPVAFGTDGILSFAIESGNFGNFSSTLNIVGDAFFGRSAGIAITATSLSNLQSGDTFQLINVTGNVIDEGIPSLIVGGFPTLPSGLAFLFDIDLSDGYTLTVIDERPANMGDFDADGDVDIDDYLAWQAAFGTLQTTPGIAGLLPADANNDGIVNAADFTVWRDNFPNPAFAASTSVPEPTAGVLLLAGLVGLATPRRRT